MSSLCLSTCECCYAVHFYNPEKKEKERKAGKNQSEVQVKRSSGSTQSPQRQSAAGKSYSERSSLGGHATSLQLYIAVITAISDFLRGKLVPVALTSSPGGAIIHIHVFMLASTGNKYIVTILVNCHLYAFPTLAFSD